LTFDGRIACSCFCDSEGALGSFEFWQFDMFCEVI
jgi:hypothetical protein